jgi:FAD/FMN-containing dehydrogenase
MMREKAFYNLAELKEHILSGVPTLYHSSKTSTVIPFENYETILNSETVLGNLSLIKGEMRFDYSYNLIVTGFVTWKEAKEFCLAHGREIMTSPTEELAGVLSGVATSATGERSFGFGNLRSQVLGIKYMNYLGEICDLSSIAPLSHHLKLKEYQGEYKKYSHLKNGPYPRFEFESDLMTGTEGQLGVITQVKLKTIKYEEGTFIFILLPKWEVDYRPHLEIFNLIQSLRNEIRACELIDANSMNYLSEEKRIGKNNDVLFLEIKKSEFERLVDLLLSKLSFTKTENIFEINSDKCHELRMSIPRAMYEINSRNGVQKKGTDVQVDADKFEELLKIYRQFSKLGVQYNLFGHFGDAHLHFNFLPSNDVDEIELCQLELESLYHKVLLLNGSPFAEHGIGILKQKFIKPFYGPIQLKTFSELKTLHDPKNQFFPEGFMGVASL